MLANHHANRDTIGANGDAPAHATKSCTIRSLACRESKSRRVKTFPARPLTAFAVALFVLTAAGCASGTAKEDGYSAFLQRIAADCKPLIIGNDNLGQAIVFNGLGATLEHYNNFLEKTSALYGGGISPATYKDSLSAFLGGGSYNDRSFDCIIAHLPAAKPTQP
jgi:hypothetical protein